MDWILQQFVTLYEAHYSSTHHPRDNMQPHKSTQIAEVQKLYRAREHPPKHCSDLQPRLIPQLTAPHWDKRKAWQYWQWQHAIRSSKSCKPTEAAQSLWLSVKRMKEQKQQGPSNSVGWQQVSYLSMRSDVRISLVEEFCSCIFLL